MNHQIKNIPFEVVQRLDSLIEFSPGQVSSKTLTKNEIVRVTLFAFGKGEELSTHTAGGDALVQVLEGEMLITIDGKKYSLTAGDTIVMPAGIPHAVSAEENAKMLLTVVFDPKG